MLKVNPEERLSITELVNQLQEIAAARNVNPKSPITEVGGVCMIVFETKNTTALDLKSDTIIKLLLHHQVVMLSLAHRRLPCCSVLSLFVVLFFKPLS